MYCFNFTTFPIPTPLKHCVSAVKVSFIFRSVCLSLLWQTVPVCLWAWPAGTSNHSGHLGGPNVTRFHPPLPASRWQQDGGRTHRGRSVLHLSVPSSFYPSIHLPSADMYNWAHHQFYSSCLSVSPLWVVWSPLSVPRAERVHALTQAHSQAPDCFLLQSCSHFLKVTTHTSIWTQSTDSQMRAKAPRGRVKAGPTPTVPHRHTHKEQHRNTVPFSLF